MQDGGPPATDPLADFGVERPSPIDAAATTAPRKPVVVRPVSRPAVPRPVMPVPAARPSRASTPKDRRVLWSFGSGAVVGAALCLIAVSWLTASEPQREPISVAPAPLAPAASEMPPPAEPPVAVADDRSDQPVVERESSAPVTTPSRDVRQVAAPSPPKGTSSAPFVGSLRIHSRPSGARVLIDGKVAGLTPLIVANLTAGSHAVRVDAEGHTPWSSAIRVIADRQTNVNTTLSRSLDNASLLP